MDYEFELQGLRFVADRDKAHANITRNGIEFERQPSPARVFPRVGCKALFGLAE